MGSAEQGQGSGPLVSVITPFYNVAAYLAEAVESVRRQTYRNWELILVDDGSIDESGAIAERLVQSDPEKICCVSHGNRANKGASAARNLGLSKAKGEYIAFLDSDDVWVPDKLEHQVNLLNVLPTVNMICGASLYWTSWADADKPDSPVRVGCRQNVLFQPPELLGILYPLQKGMAPSMNGLLVERSVMDRIGGFVDEFKGMYDDQVFLTKIYLSCSVYVSDKIYDKYRRNRPGSLCYLSLTSDDYREHRLQYLRWLKDYLSTAGCDHPGIKRAFYRELWKCRFPACARGARRVKEKKRQIKSGIKLALKWSMKME